MNKLFILKSAAAGAVAFILAMIFGIIRYSPNRLRLDDNAVLATIGLAAICYILFNFIVSVFQADVQRKQIKSEADRIDDAIKKGIKLAEDDALEKLTQKTHATMTPPPGKPMQ